MTLSQSNNFESDWQSLLDNDPRADFYHTLSWQRIMRKVYWVKPMYQLIQHGSDFAAMTAFESFSILSGRKITSMPFNFYPVPLYSSEQTLIKLINNVQQVADERKIKKVEIKSTQRISEEVLKQTQLIETKPFYNSTLSLDKEYIHFFNGLTKSARQNLNTLQKRFKKEPFTIGKVESEKDLADFYDLLVRIYRDRHKMVCQPYLLYRELFTYKRSDFKCDIKVVKLNDKICAAIVVIFGNHKRAYYCWGVTDEKYRHLGLNYLLVDGLIKELINEGYETLDFGTTPASNSNLLFFKNRWGCQSTWVYYYYLYKAQQQVDLNTGFLAIRNLYRWVPLYIIKLVLPVIIPQLV